LTLQGGRGIIAFTAFSVFKGLMNCLIYRQ
jgi:hypothetical protein